MTLLDRSLSSPILKVLKKKMVFLGGPRQVGKTTLALRLLGPKATQKHAAYFNWDNPLGPNRLRNMDLPADPLLEILFGIRNAIGGEITGSFMTNY